MLVIGADAVAAVVKFKVKERSLCVTPVTVGVAGVAIGVPETLEDTAPLSSEP
jgi:hypothetical protein